MKSQYRNSNCGQNAVRGCEAAPGMLTRFPLPLNVLSPPVFAEGSAANGQAGIVAPSPPAGDGTGIGVMSCTRDIPSGCGCFLGGGYVSCGHDGDRRTSRDRAGRTKGAAGALGAAGARLAGAGDPGAALGD